MLNGDKVIADIERDLSLEEKIADLEAQAAAMRKALENVRAVLLASERTLTKDVAIYTLGGELIPWRGEAQNIIGQALSTDAGKKMLAVVEAAKASVKDNRAMFHEDAPRWTDCGCAGPQTEKLADALAATDKP